MYPIIYLCHIYCCWMYLLFFLDACDFSVFFTLSFFPPPNGSIDVFLHRIQFCSHMFIIIFDNHVGSIYQCLFCFILTPTCFSHRYTWFIRCFGNGSLIFEDMISVLDLLYPVNYKIKGSFEYLTGSFFRYLFF